MGASEPSRLIVAGVDGGATRTRAVVLELLGAREVRVYTGSSGPSNPLNVGPEEAGRNIRRSVERALEGVGYSVEDLACTAAGLAGLDSVLVWRELEPEVKKHAGIPKLVLEHDAHILLLAATRGAPGVIAIAGTGSIAYAYTASGERVIVGDRGWLLGDEGSGFWIARRALRRLARALDGRMPRDCLTELLSLRLGVKNSDELMYWFYKTQGRVDRIAAVAVYVVEAAEQGCEAALEIVREGAVRFAECIVTAVKRAGLKISEVYAAGSIWKCGVFRSTVEEVLAPHGLRLVETDAPPVLGALYLALLGAGLSPGEARTIAFSDRVVKTSRKLYS